MLDADSLPGMVLPWVARFLLRKGPGRACPQRSLVISPMLAGSTLYREKAERNKKKHCFHTTFDSPMELFPRLCVVGFQLTRSARRRQADTAPCCDEPEYHAAWIILRQAKALNVYRHAWPAVRRVSLACSWALPERYQVYWWVLLVFALRVAVWPPVLRWLQHPWR